MGEGGGSTLQIFALQTMKKPILSRLLLKAISSEQFEDAQSTCVRYTLTGCLQAANCFKQQYKQYTLLPDLQRALPTFQLKADSSKPHQRTYPYNGKAA